MFRKILCATDGSAHSDIAVSQAVDLAKSEGATLSFVMVNVATGGPHAPHDVLRYGLALLPAALFILYFVKVAAEVALDPTSHNLWPFEMAFLLMFWAAYLTGMRIALGIAGYFIPTRI